MVMLAEDKQKGTRTRQRGDFTDDIVHSLVGVVDRSDTEYDGPVGRQTELSAKGGSLSRVRRVEIPGNLESLGKQSLGVRCGTRLQGRVVVRL